MTVGKLPFKCSTQNNRFEKFNTFDSDQAPAILPGDFDKDVARRGEFHSVGTEVGEDGAVMLGW